MEDGKNIEPLSDELIARANRLYGDRGTHTVLFHDPPEPTARPRKEIHIADLLSTITDLKEKLATASADRDRYATGCSLMTEHYLSEQARADASEQENKRLREALESIESVCGQEITARFGGHPSRTEDENGKHSKVYPLLAVPRHIARAALSPQQTHRS